MKVRFSPISFDGESVHQKGKIEISAHILHWCDLIQEYKLHSLCSVAITWDPPRSNLSDQKGLSRSWCPTMERIAKVRETKFVAMNMFFVPQKQVSVVSNKYFPSCDKVFSCLSLVRDENIQISVRPLGVMPSQVSSSERGKGESSGNTVIRSAILRQSS